MQGPRIIRLATGLTLLLMLFGATLTQASAADGPFITIHNRLCPVDYAGDDLYGDCHDTPQVAGIEFSIDGPESATGVTDSAGNITFAELYTGTYTISGGETAEPVTTVVYCSYENEPETLHLVDPAQAGVNFPAEGPSNGYICDWYHIPAAGSDPDDGEDPQDNGWYTLTIHNRICPVEYAGSSFYEDCHDNPQTSNLEFNVITGGDMGVAHGQTDDAGDVTFENIPPGYYTLVGGVSSEFADAVVYCSIEGIDGSGQFATETEFGFQLATNPNALGWHYICDWYNIPFDLNGDDATATPTPVAGSTASPTPVAGDDDDAGDVTDLPNAGAGATADSNSNLAIYALGLFALGMAAVAVRRRVTS